MNDHLDPANTVISKVGGFDAVAEITGAHVSRVYRWTYPAERGGTGGTIPQRYHRTLLDYARGHSIDLSAEDFIAPAEQAA